MSDNFVHTHLHTEYSFLDGLSKVWDDAAKEPGDLISILLEIGQNACTITDHGSISGWGRFDKACSKNDIKPIFGVEGYYCNNRHIKGLNEAQKLEAIRGINVAADSKKAVKTYELKKGLSKKAHFVCLAMNSDGVKEILKTLSLANTEGFYRKPRWDFELIQGMKNCIFGTACAGGILNYYLNVYHSIYPNSDIVVVYKMAQEAALKEAEKWKSVLGDRFYIELQPIDWDQQVIYNRFCYNIAQQLDIKCYLANDSHYVYQSDWEVHDVLLAIQSFASWHGKNALTDPKRLRYDMHDLFVKTRKEMFSSFYKRNKLDEYPKSVVSEMLNNTVEIADRCNGKLTKKKMIMPNISVPENHTQVSYLKELTIKGWKKKIVPYVDPKNLPEYKARLKEELIQIIKQGFTPYFILCNHLMKWVDENDIARGPARGSSAGSLVAYLLSITMVDPIPHRLLFSRFIDPNRSDFPDIDMDFEDTRRREVVQYLIDTYGKDNVAILGNNMGFRPKLALKDVARMYNVPLMEVQEMCNLVLERSGADSRLSFCLEDTFTQFECAKEFAQKYPKVVEFSKKLEGRVSRTGTHAAAVVIADGDIHDYTALRVDKKNPDFLVSTIDKQDAEDLGLLKLDVLGLNNMSIIQECKKLIRKRYKKNIQLESICRHVTYKGGEAKVYKEFADGHTTGIFQFMTPGLTRFAIQAKIDKFSEIAAATALHRPSGIHCIALGRCLSISTTSGELYIDDLLDRKFGVFSYDYKKDRLITKIGKAFKTGKQKVYKVKTKSGRWMYCTNDERFNVGNGKYKKLKNLSLGDRVYYI